MNGIVTTTADLVAVIKACGEHGVESLELDSLKLKFVVNEYPNQNKNIALSQEVISGANELNHEETSHSTTDQNEAIPTYEQMLAEEYLAQLSIEDPALYEEMTLKKLQEEGN